MWIQIDATELKKHGLDYVQAKIKASQADEQNPDTAKYRAAADVREGELEVDPDAVVSFSDDGGAYVMSWQWVSAKEIGLSTCDECGERVSEVVGCPDGAEVCRDCFNAGAH